MVLPFVSYVKREKYSHVALPPPQYSWKQNQVNFLVIGVMTIIFSVHCLTLPWFRISGLEFINKLAEFIIPC